MSVVEGGCEIGIGGVWWRCRRLGAFDGGGGGGGRRNGVVFNVIKSVVILIIFII